MRAVDQLVGGRGAPTATVVDMFRHRVSTGRSSPAVVHGESVLSYGGLDGWSDALAERHLRGRIGVGDRVAISLRRTPLFVAAAMAAAKCGAAYLPIDHRVPAARRSFLVGDSDASLLLSEQDVECAPPAAVERIDLDPTPVSGPAVPTPELTGSDVAYCIYTSGSSGSPKGALLTHGGLANTIGWYVRGLGVGPGDRVALIGGLGFDAAVMEMWGALCAGAALVILDDPGRLTPRELVIWLTANAVTVAFVPTVLAERILDQRWPAESSMRLLLTGGDRLMSFPADHVTFDTVNLYGPCEATVLVTACTVPKRAQADGRWPAIGRPIDNMEVFLVGESGEPVGAGGTGEIIVAGPGVGLGYCGGTADRPLRSEWNGRVVYRTGDWATVRPDGNYEFVGRRDQQIQLRGHRIELVEIERHLLDRGGVVAAAAVPLETDGRCQAIAAFVVPGDGTQPDLDGIRRHLTTVLPGYMVPTVLRVVPELPLTTNGKLDRAGLAATVRTGHGDQPGTVRTDPDPDGSPAQRILRIFAEVLDEEGLGPEPQELRADADFFALGGHSVLVPVVIDRLERELRVSLPADVIFEAASAAALAELVEDQRARAPDAD